MKNMKYKCSEILMCKESSIIKLFNDIYIHFVLEKKIEKTVILKKYTKTLRSIVNLQNLVLFMMLV